MNDWDLRPARDLDLSLGKRLRSERRESGLISMLAQLGARTLTRIALKIYHRVEYRHRERLPRDCPLVLIANHSSHLDSVVLATMVPWRIRRRMFPIAAGDVFFETPLLTVFAAGIINALPMWRKNVGRHALDDLRTRLVEDRCAYILFPEGRRSPDGSLLPFKAGLGMLIAGTDIPVVPCYIDGAHLALRRLTWIPRPVKITVTVGNPLVFADTPGTKQGWRDVTSRCESAVRALAGLPPAPDPSSTD